MQTTDPFVVAALDLLVQSRARVHVTRRLLSESLYRIAASRRRLNPAFALEGSSDEQHQALRKSIRDRLATGALSPAGLRIVSGDGRGNDCVVCCTPIAPADVEYEIPLRDNVTVVSHLLCWVLWRDESNRRRLLREIA